MDDHNLMAKQEHIEAIEAELDRMKKIATHVYEEMVSHTRRTSYSTHSTCFGSTLPTYSTYAPQVYMRDRSDAMHITSESTRGRHRGIWLVARAVSAVPQQCRSSAAARHPEPPRARTWHPGYLWHWGSLRNRRSGLSARSLGGGRTGVGPDPQFGAFAPFRLSRQFGSQSPIHLGSALVAPVAVVNNLLDLPRRLLWVEVSMMCVLLFMGLWQIHYLKRYFQTKKLI